MKFRIVEENELEKRARYHRKRQKGMSPFYSPDGGNVPLAIDRFNNSVADGANGLMEDLGVSQKAKIILDYYDEGGLCSEHVEDAIYTLWPNYYSLYSRIDELSENQLKTVYDYIVDKYQTEIDIYGEDADLPYPAYELFKYSLDFSNDESNYKESLSESIDGYTVRDGLIRRIDNFLSRNKNTDKPVGYINPHSNEYNYLKIKYGDYVTTPFVNVTTDEIINYALNNGLVSKKELIIDDLRNAGLPVSDSQTSTGDYIVTGSAKKRFISILNKYNKQHNTNIGYNFDTDPWTITITESINEDFKHDPLKAVVLSAIDFLWDAGFPHPDNWISDDWMNLKDGVETGVDDLVETAENLKSYLKSYMDGKNSVLDIEGDDANYDLIHILTDFYYDIDKYMNKSESLKEDTVKNSDGTWSNKGDEGSHGKFRTKKQADNQRKAMFANGYHESLKESVDIDDAKLEKELTNIFNQNHLYPEEMYVKNGEIYVYISNGDWKHEHLKCKWLVNEVLDDQGLVTVDYLQRVTDDDGSDTYSAEHIWKVSTEDDVDEVDFTKYNFNI